MIKDKRNIDSLFEAGLKKFKEAPPAYSWDKLDKSLDKAKFNKSMVYLRWMAASILILLAFGAGYYYAIYNLNTPMVADDINQSTVNHQNINSTDRLSSSNLESEKPETPSIPEKQKIKNNQFEDITQLNLKDELFASNNKSNIERSQLHSSDEINTVQIDQETPGEKVTSMKIINFTNLLVSQQPAIILKDDIQIPDVNSEIAQTEAASMSIHYYPEDYNLNTPKKELDTKWAVGAQFAPVVSYRDISINYETQQGSIVDNNESQYSNTEDALHSYAGGVDVNYNMSKRWSLQSGLYFSRIGQVNNDALNFKQANGVYQLSSINTSTGNANIVFEKVPENIRKGDIPKDDSQGSMDIENAKIVQNFDLFEVPVMVKYKVLNKRFGINLLGGLSPAYLVKNSTYLEIDNTKHDIGSSENLNPMIFNTTFSLGFNYGITKKLSINFEPTFKYSLSPINNNSEFYYHPYSFSWYTGIRFSF